VDQLEEFAHKDPQHKYPASWQQLAQQAKAGSPYDWQELEARFAYLPTAEYYADNQPVVIEKPGHYAERDEGWVSFGNTQIARSFGDEYRNLLVTNGLLNQAQTHRVPP
jgi:hypothetical protein